MDRQSTDNDVQKLLELGFHPGETVSWEAIEEALGLTRQEHRRRFSTVCDALKRHKRKWHNHVVRTKTGKGLYVLKDTERAADVGHTLIRTIPLHEKAVKDADDIPIVHLNGSALEDAHHARVAAHKARAATKEHIAALASRPTLLIPTPTGPRRPRPAPDDSQKMPQAS